MRTSDLTHSRLIHAKSEPCPNDGADCARLQRARQDRQDAIDRIRTNDGPARAVTSETDTGPRRPVLGPVSPVGSIPEWMEGPTAPAPARHLILVANDEGWTARLVANGGAIHPLWDAAARPLESFRWNTEAERTARTLTTTVRWSVPDVLRARESQHVAEPDGPAVFLPTVSRPAAAAIEQRTADRHYLEGLMSDDATGGGLLPIGRANMESGPSVGQAWEQAQANYGADPYAPCEDGPLGRVTVTYADGRTETIEPSEASRAPRPVKCATRTVRVMPHETCGKCSTCRGRDRKRAHDLRKRQRETAERGERARTALERARGARDIAARML